MDQLPIELVHYIFGYLDLIDLCKCKLVQKKFYKFVKLFRIKELVLNGYDLRENVYRNWLYTKRLLNYNYMVDSRLENLDKIKMDLNYLRRLKIDYPTLIYELDLELINRFELLTELSIRCFKLDIIGTETELKLTNLISFELIIDENMYDPIQLNTPKLKGLLLEYIPESMTFCYPLTVEYLEINQYCPYLMKFKNLVYLKCEYDLFDLNILTNLPKLKKFVTLVDLTELRSIVFLKLLIVRKRKLKRNDLKIFCDCFEVLKPSDINTICLSSIRGSFPFLQTLDRIDFTLFPIYVLGFEPLLELIKLTHRLYNRMQFIQMITIEKRVIYQANWLSFMSHCLSLSRLVVRNTNLNQLFYNKLPQVCSLVLLETYDKRDLNLNFEFINKMFNLLSFKTDQQLSLDSNLELNRLKYLDLIQFKIQQDDVIIIKFERNSYELFVNDELKSKKLTFEQLIELCKKWKKRTKIHMTRSRIKRLKRKSVDDNNLNE